VEKLFLTQHSSAAVLMQYLLDFVVAVVVVVAKVKIVVALLVFGIDCRFRL
jgi:hypothetical protein